LTGLKQKVEILGLGLAPIGRLMGIAAHDFDRSDRVFYRQASSKNQPGRQYVSGSPSATLAVHHHWLAFALLLFQERQNAFFEQTDITQVIVRYWRPTHIVWAKLSAIGC
jgi:hypothetical protein